MEDNAALRSLGTVANRCLSGDRISTVGVRREGESLGIQKPN